MDKDKLGQVNMIFSAAQRLAFSIELSEENIPQDIKNLRSYLDQLEQLYDTLPVSESLGGGSD